MRAIARRLEALEGGNSYSQLGEWLDSIGGAPPAKPMHPDLRAALDDLPKFEGNGDADD